MTADKPLRLVEKDGDTTDKERKALCCYGVLLPQSELPGTMLLHFVDGRPISQMAINFLAWLIEKIYGYYQCGDEARLAQQVYLLCNCSR